MSPKVGGIPSCCALDDLEEVSLQQGGQGPQGWKEGWVGRDNQGVPGRIIGDEGEGGIRLGYLRQVLMFYKILTDFWLISWCFTRNLEKKYCVKVRVFQFWGHVAFKIGEGNGTTLQYFCLENPMDRGAWWAAVHGVTASRTRLSDFTFTFYFHALEEEMATLSSVLAWRIPGTEEPGRRPSMGLHRVGHDWSDLAASCFKSYS